MGTSGDGGGGVDEGTGGDEGQGGGGGGGGAEGISGGGGDDQGFGGGGDGGFDRGGDGGAGFDPSAGGGAVNDLGGSGGGGGVETGPVSGAIDSGGGGFGGGGAGFDPSAGGGGFSSNDSGAGGLGGGGGGFDAGAGGGFGGGGLDFGGTGGGSGGGVDLGAGGGGGDGGDPGLGLGGGVGDQGAGTLGVPGDQGGPAFDPSQGAGAAFSAPPAFDPTAAYGTSLNQAGFNPAPSGEPGRAAALGAPGVAALGGGGALGPGTGDVLSLTSGEPGDILGAVDQELPNQPSWTLPPKDPTAAPSIQPGADVAAPALPAPGPWQQNLRSVSPSQGDAWAATQPPAVDFSNLNAGVPPATFNPATNTWSDRAPRSAMTGQERSVTQTGSGMGSFGATSPYSSQQSYDATMGQLGPVSAAADTRGTANQMPDTPGGPAFTPAEPGVNTFDSIGINTWPGPEQTTTPASTASPEQFGPAGPSLAEQAGINDIGFASAMAPDDSGLGKSMGPLTIEDVLGPTFTEQKPQMLDPSPQLFDKNLEQQAGIEDIPIAPLPSDMTLPSGPIPVTPEIVTRPPGFDIAAPQVAPSAPQVSQLEMDVSKNVGPMANVQPGQFTGFGDPLKPQGVAGDVLAPNGPTALPPVQGPLGPIPISAAAVAPTNGASAGGGGSQVADTSGGGGGAVPDRVAPPRPAVAQVPPPAAPQIAPQAVAAQAQQQQVAAVAQQVAAAQPQLTPQQVQQVAAFQNDLTNQWKQILINQGATDPVNSPAWPQVKALVAKQVNAQFGLTGAQQVAA